jgi:hypothetical protein
MKYLVLICLIGLGLGLMAFGLVTPSDPEAAVGPNHPAALLLDMERNLRLFGSAARELARGLLEEFLNPYRERFQHKTAG